MQGASAGLLDMPLPMQPVERQGSLADLLFEILDEGDTDDLLLADLNRCSKAAAAAQQQQQQLRAQGNLGQMQQPQPQQPPLLQQLQQRKLLERLQASTQQQGDLQDMFALRDMSNGTSSSLAASQAAGTGASTSPWPSFTSPAGQSGPGAAALVGSSNQDPAQAAAAQDAGAALLQQLQLRVQQGGSAPASLPALKAAAGVAEGALLERQAMKKQLLQQLQQQRQGQGQQQQQSMQVPGSTPMAAAAGDLTQQEPQQQDAGAAAAVAGAQAGGKQTPGEAMPTEQPAAAAAAGVDAPLGTAGLGLDAAGGNCSAATAAALLAEGGDDLLDLDFLETMLQVR